MKNIKVVVTPGYIHRIVPVDIQPVTVMTCWRLVQVGCVRSKRTRHLIGRADGEGRVTSAIVNFNLHTLQATTKSGRLYVLEGPAGRDLDADYVFDLWLRGQGITCSTDITRALLRMSGRPRRVGAVGHVNMH